MIRMVLLVMIALLGVVGVTWVCDNTKYGGPLALLSLILFGAAVTGYALTGSIW